MRPHHCLLPLMHPPLALAQSCFSMDARSCTWHELSLTLSAGRYSTIEKELLAVVFALRRCHFYTYFWPTGTNLDRSSFAAGPRGLRSRTNDTPSASLHGALVPVFSHVGIHPGKYNFIPDYLSRMSPGKPSPVEIHEALTYDAADKRFTQLLLGGGPFYEHLAVASLQDLTFAYLRKGVRKGWSRKAPAHLPLAAKYWPLRFKHWCPARSSFSRTIGFVYHRAWWPRPSNFFTRVILVAMECWQRPAELFTGPGGHGTWPTLFMLVSRAPRKPLPYRSKPNFLSHPRRTQVNTALQRFWHLRLMRFRRERNQHPKNQRHDFARIC